MILKFNKRFHWLDIIFHPQESVIPVIWRRVLGVMLSLRSRSARLCLIMGLKPRRLFILEWGRRKTLHLAHKIFTN